MTQHHFTTELADEVGVMKAILIDNIHFWWLRNIANEKNKHDGLYWTFNSSRAFLKMFHYMSRASITRYLSELERDGWLVSGNYNKAKYDRTKWYTLTEKTANVLSINLNRPSPLLKVDNGIAQSEQPIPDSKPNNKPLGITQSQKAVWFDAFWLLYPVKKSKASSRLAFDKAVKDVKDFNHICSQLKAFKLTQQWREGITALRTGGKCYIKHAVRWISSGDYMDDLNEQLLSTASPKVTLSGDGLTPQQHGKFLISLMAPGETIETAKHRWMCLQQDGKGPKTMKKWKAKHGITKPK